MANIRITVTECHMTTELLKHRQHSNLVTAIALTAFVFVLALFAQLRPGADDVSAEATCTVDAPLTCMTAEDEATPRSSFAATFIH